MNRKANFLVVVSVFTLVCALAKDEAAAQAITVNPANPTISVGQTQQFTATGVDITTAVAAGDYHTCALLQNGAARCWGLNSTGQLGDGSTTNSATPVAVVGIAGAAAVTSGGGHTCARFPDGTVECWGQNDVGQLGDGSTTNSTTPVTVSGITTATAVSSGYFHTCAVLQDGTVRCWGDNTYGQLGDGTTIIPPAVRGGPSTAHSATPVTVSGISTAVTVAAADGFHTCAVLQDGTVRCWGDNSTGQLGNGSTTNSSTPVTVSGITTATAVTGGDYHTCALLQDGTVRCWGLNYSGQLGNGSVYDSSTPVTVSGISTAVAVSIGVIHTCASLQDGTVRCWGDNSSGQLGNGSTTNSSTPVTVSGISTATAVTSGYNDACALLQGGSLQCWGINNYGQLGNGTTTDAHTPVAVAGIGVTWTSSDSTVATINATGLTTGVSSGSTTITATSGDRSGSTTLTVVGRPTLAVVKAGSGSGTVTSSPPGIDCGTTCSAPYDGGTVVTLTATPATGSTFTGWNGCDTVSGTTCTVTMNASRSVTATFTLQRFTLTVNKAGSGTVTSSPPGIDCGTTCSAPYDGGTVVTLTATPAIGSIFTGWSGCNAASGTTCTVAMSAATSVTATFTLQRFTLTVNKAGMGSGTVTSNPPGIDCGTTCSAPYDGGTVVTLTATPATGSIFTGWSGCDAVSGTTCTVTMSAARSVTASFLGMPLP
jgi:alpha-tubulin suppressor-like RCC1 family protein